MAPTTQATPPSETAKPAGGGPGPAQAPNYLIIDAATLLSGEKLGFDLLLLKESGDSTVVVRSGEKLSDQAKEGLSQSNQVIAVAPADRDKYWRYLEQNLGDMITDPAVEKSQAARAAYDLSRNLMNAALNSPSPAALQRAQAVIDSTAGLVVSSPDAMTTLLRLTRHDPHTYTHACNVGIYGLGLMKSLVDEGESHDLSLLAEAFFFHDIGMSEVQREVLHRPGPLSYWEYMELKRHPKIGLRLLKDHPLAGEDARFVVLQHHERLDGSGYPYGSTGDQIHLYGRVGAIADVFDALTSERPYRGRLGAFEAIQVMQVEMAGQFDDELLRRFIGLFAESHQ